MRFSESTREGRQGGARAEARRGADGSQQQRAMELGLDPDAVYPLGETERHVLLPVAAGERIKLGLRYEAGPAAPNTAERFRVMSMDGATVLGGGTYVLRH